MQRRARSAVAAVVALAATTALAGCGTGTGGGGKELHVLIGNIAQYPAEQRAWMDRIKQEFKAKTGADVVFETYANSGEEQTKLQTSVVSGTGPDVYVLGTTFMPVAYATKGFQVLGDAEFQKIGGKSRFLPEAMAMSGPDPAHQIAVPMSVRPYGMVYNTELFKQAGIPGPPSTWDEYLADAKRLNNPDAGVYGTAVPYSDGFDPWKYIWTFALQSGGRLISDDLTKAQLDSPQVRSATQHYFDLLTKDHVVDPKAVSWKAPEAVAAFAAGKAGMLGMVAPTVMPSLDKSPVKGKYEFAPLPLVPFDATQRPPGGLAAGSIVSGDNLAVASYTKNKDLALSYVELVTNPDEQKFFSQTFGDVPGNAQAAKDLAATDPKVDSYVKAEQASVPTSFTGAWSDVQLGLTNTVAQTLPSLANGSYDPAAVAALLTQANQKTQASLDRHRN